MKTGTSGQEQRHRWLRVVRLGLFAIGLAYCFKPTLPSLLAQVNPPSGGPGGGPTLTLSRSTEVLRDIVPSIPTAVLDQAECVIVIPGSSKAAFLVGGSYGRGVISCRSGRAFNGPWSSPATVLLEGGAGLLGNRQGNGLVLLIVNENAADSVLDGKVKIGSTISLSAGPDRNETLAGKTSDMFSYHGVGDIFSGSSLSGTTIRPDNVGTKELYGRDIDAAYLVRYAKSVPPIPAAARFLSLMNKISPRNWGKHSLE